jgi:hypothetical protein
MSVPGGAGLGHAVAGVLEQQAECLPEQRVVFDEQDGSGRSHESGES